VLRVQEAKAREGDSNSNTNNNKGSSGNSNESDTIKLNDCNPNLDEGELRKFFGNYGSIKRVFKPENKNFA